MKSLKIVMSLLVWSFICGMVVSSLSKIGVSPMVSGLSFLLVTFFLSALPERNAGVYKMDVDVQIWQKEIIKRLFKDNSFLKYSRSENQYVIGGAAVLIPQPGAQPEVVKNRSVFPAVAVRRSDTTVLYALDNYSTTPTHITLNELQTISYDKIQSVITDHFGYLLQDVADDMLVKWSANIPNDFIVKTTGDATAALDAGQTGMRKAFTFKDLQTAQRLMSKANVPKDGRIALLEENMYQQLVDSLSSTQYKDFSRAFNQEDGTMPRLFGFDIMTRSSVITAQSNNTINAFDAVIGATDNVGCLCWHRDVVANAQGAVNLFTRPNDPLYYGDINSCSIRAGGRVRRGDNVGMVAILQDSAVNAN